MKTGANTQTHTHTHTHTHPYDLVAVVAVPALPEAVEAELCQPLLHLRTHNNNIN